MRRTVAFGYLAGVAAVALPTSVIAKPVAPNPRSQFGNFLPPTLSEDFEEKEVRCDFPADTSIASGSQFSLSSLPHRRFPPSRR